MFYPIASYTTNQRLYQHYYSTIDIFFQYNNTGWWFQTFFQFFHILGMSSSQLTNSYFFRAVGQPPTRISYKTFDIVGISPEILALT